MNVGVLNCGKVPIGFGIAEELVPFGVIYIGLLDFGTALINCPTEMYVCCANESRSCRENSS